MSKAPPSTVTYERWSAALLDVLLPKLPMERHGQIVLLACDDDAIYTAATMLDATLQDPTTEFGRVIEARFHIARDGSPDSIRRSTVRFRANTRDATELPPFFGACCAFVLAASHMTTDKTAHAVNYYDRLWELLGCRPNRDNQYDFSYLPHLFRYLAEWLRDDIHGERGHLHVLENESHHVGYAINQCLFRACDKGQLAEFFASRVGRRREKIDLLRLLQVSADRHHLTNRAQQAVATPELQELTQAALIHEFETWDGSRPDPHGGRSWLANLHLSVNRRLRLTISAPAAPKGLALDTARVLEHPERDRVPLHPGEFSELATHGLRWGSTNSNGIYLPRAGDTLIFEVREDTGLVWIPEPSAERVFVLTSDRPLQRRLAAYAMQVGGADVLPRGWFLYEHVPSDCLPGRTEGSATIRPPVALVGGLRIGTHWYLTGYGPRIEVGDVEKPLSVSINDSMFAVVDPGGHVELDLPAGEHQIDVSDGLMRWTVHMLTRNVGCSKYGRLAFPLTDRGARGGAVERNQAEGPTICGALLSAPHTGDVPLMLRPSKVVIIAADGSSEIQDAPDPPGWLAHLGLPTTGIRWEAQLKRDAVWALSSQQAIAIRPVVPAQLDAEARAAVDALCQMPKPRVRSLHREHRAAAVEAFMDLATLPEIRFRDGLY